MAVSSLEMTDAAWQKLLAAKNAPFTIDSETTPAFALFAPIVATTGPFVLAQVGQSLDGRVATPSGDARDISGPDGLAHLHRCRALVDAVIVGEVTVSHDNPKLSVRLVEGPDPVRVVIDCHSRLVGTENLFHDGGAPVIVIQNEDAPKRIFANAEVINLPCGETGLAPQDILSALHARGLNRILVEGGARTIARFVDQNLVDRLHIAVAPIIIGSGPSGIALPEIARLSEAYKPQTTVYDLGSDMLFDCQLK